MMYRFILAVHLSMAASFVFAQVEVVDREIPVTPEEASVPQSTTNPAQLYYQMQVLQQEVLQLRGLVEQQAFEIKKLKQQRLDDYLDLDRRVSQLSQRGSAAPLSSDSATPETQTSVVSSPPGEMKRYKAAMNLVFKEQKYDEAVVALTEYLNEFPTGRYSANAQYWLGEVYLKKQDLEQARQWFSKVLNEHPQHGKASDAQYKLGIVYHKLGDNDKARDLLENVAQTDANAARLARDYLDSNFSDS